MNLYKLCFVTKNVKVKISVTFFKLYIYSVIYAGHFLHVHHNCSWKRLSFSLFNIVWQTVPWDYTHRKRVFWMLELNYFTFKLKLQLDCLVSLFTVSHVLLNHEDSSTLSYPCRIFQVFILNHHEVVWPLERSNQPQSIYSHKFHLPDLTSFLELCTAHFPVD